MTTKKKPSSFSEISRLRYPSGEEDPGKVPWLLSLTGENHEGEGNSGRPHLVVSGEVEFSQGKEDLPFKGKKSSERQRESKICHAWVTN